MAIGAKPTNNQTPPLPNICQANPASIFKRVWPAIIFANNRIDKLRTRAAYETVSIRIIKGAINTGHPGGKKIPKNPNLCILAPTIFTPIKLAAAMARVTARELVTVKLYGTIPTKLDTNIKENTVKTYGTKTKNILCFAAVFSLTMPPTNPTMLSENDCTVVDGTRPG
jgi:hypothetical protein